MSSSNNEHKVEKKQTTSKVESKKRKLTTSEQMPKPQKEKVDDRHKEPIKNFEKILITEKDHFNKSQKYIFDRNKIKIGER